LLVHSRGVHLAENPLTILEDLQEWLREAVELARTIPAGATVGAVARIRRSQHE